MSSYARYCQRQALECARRARMASSPDVAAYQRALGLHWVKLAQKERAKSGLKAWFAKPIDSVRVADPAGNRYSVGIGRRLEVSRA
jgi:hypothetical protein